MNGSKTKAEKFHLSRVAGMGCIVCKNLKLGETPAEIHHIRTSQGVGQRADNFKVIPICHTHHRNGGHGVEIYAGRQSWENKFVLNVFWSRTLSRAFNRRGEVGDIFIQLLSFE